jgi:hypothetical protein
LHWLGNKPAAALGLNKRIAPGDAAPALKANRLVCFYKESLSVTTGLVQQPDQVVARCARTTYPYSLAVLNT